MATNPINRFKTWLARAERAGISRPNAMALATAGAGGRPSVRFILVKRIDDRGLVFFGDRRSRKGRDLQENPSVAAVFYWDAIGKQVRFEGRVEEITPEEVDQYWNTRSRGKRLAASSSCQSAFLTHRRQLRDRVDALRKRYRGRPIPRPPQWTGFRIIPDRIEFWVRRAHRLHDREVFLRTARGWKVRRLQP